MVANAQLLRQKAQKCRELADTAITEEGRHILHEIAQNYEIEASTAAIARGTARRAEALPA